MEHMGIYFPMDASIKPYETMLNAAGHSLQGAPKQSEPDRKSIRLAWELQHVMLKKINLPVALMVFLLDNHHFQTHTRMRVSMYLYIYIYIYVIYTYIKVYICIYICIYI